MSPGLILLDGTGDMNLFTYSRCGDLHFVWVQSSCKPEKCRGKNFGFKFRQAVLIVRLRESLKTEWKYVLSSSDGNMAVCVCV